MAPRCSLGGIEAHPPDLPQDEPARLQWCPEAARFAAGSLPGNACPLPGNTCKACARGGQRIRFCKRFGARPPRCLRANNRQAPGSAGLRQAGGRTADQGRDPDPLYRPWTAANPARRTSLSEERGNPALGRFMQPSRPNLLSGLGGADGLYARDGNDTLIGGAGSDTPFARFHPDQRWSRYRPA